MGWLRKASGKVTGGLTSAGRTLTNIGRDTQDFGRKAVKDTAKATVRTARNLGDLPQLFDNPSQYFKDVVSPTLGNGYEPGLWDKYGGLMAAVPGVGQTLYPIMNTVDATYDYHNTGDEELYRKRMRDMAATMGGAYLGQSAGNYVAADTGLGAGSGYSANVTQGAVSGGTSSALRGDEGNDITRNAIVGGTAAGVGTALGGAAQRDMTTGEVALDSTGKPMYYGDTKGSLNLGAQANQFGQMAVGTTNNILVNNERKRDYRDALNRYLQMYRSNSRTNTDTTPSSPEIAASITGTPLEQLFLSPEEKAKQKSKNTFGSSGLGSVQSQVSNPQEKLYDGQGSSYYL